MLLFLYWQDRFGKPYTALSFGEGNYKNTVYFNMEDSVEVAAIFERDFDTEHIIYILFCLSV
ncbi:MAG: hypothetical protein K2J76_08300 [Oscillospiraceae bacterium]|nr:hypothetical protein [Oscillospiraceae bacterium]